MPLLLMEIRKFLFAHHNTSNGTDLDIPKFQSFLGLLDFPIEQDEEEEREEESEERFPKRVKKIMTGKETRQQMFLNDPTDATKIFFSSFLHSKGIFA